MTRYTRTVRRKLPNRGRARAHPDPGYATRAAWRFTSRTTTSDGGVSRKWTVKGAPYAFFACRLQAPAVLFDDLAGSAKALPREGSRECLIPALLGWFAAGPPPAFPRGADPNAGERQSGGSQLDTRCARAQRSLSWSPWLGSMYVAPTFTIWTSAAGSLCCSYTATARAA